MSDLTKAQPPAWAMSEGYALNSIALTTELEQEQYQLAVSNAQAQGKACQFQQSSAIALAEQESNTQSESAWGAIVGGCIQGTSVVASMGISGLAFRNTINTETENLNNVNKWDAAIQDVSSGKKGADIIASYNSGTGPAVNTNAIRLANGSEAFNDDETIAQIATLKAQPNGESDFDTLASNVAANKKSIEDRLSRAYGERSTWESRIGQVLGSQGGGVSGLAGQGIFGLRAAQSKSNEAQYQALQQLAQFMTTVTGTISNLITTGVNNAQSLILSIAENTILGPGSANRI